MEGRVERRRAHRRRRRWALGTLCIVAVIAALATLLFLRNSDHSKTVVATPTSVATTAAPAATPNALIAQAVPDKVPVYDDPTSTTPSNDFDNPWFVNNDPNAAVPLVF